MSNPNHVAFTPDMFEGSEDWRQRYASGLCHCNRGITGLRTSDINPFHPAIKDRSVKPERLIIYQITNNNTNHVSWWLEADYKAAFAEYRKQLTDNPYCQHNLFLVAAVIPKAGTAEQSWQAFFGDGEHEDHNYTMYWYDKYNSWMF